MPTLKRPKRIPLLDAHNDSIILREVRGDPMDFSAADRVYQVDLRRMKRGGVGGLFVMVGDRNLLQSLRIMGAMHRMCAARRKEFALCLTAEGLLAAMHSGRIGVVMSIESQTMFAERPENVRNWHRLGVRVASLTHGEGKLGDSSHALQVDNSFFGYLEPDARRILRRQSKGLTAFARESLNIMAELKIPCDLAHANDAAFWQVLECARGPVCYTHGACYALCKHSRNLSDEMMRALAARGGVMGICFYGNFIDEKRPTLDRLVDHFAHALEVMGPDHVGVGSDFDGIARTQVPIIQDAGRVPALWEAMERRGIPKSVVEKIAWKNFLRLLP